MKILRQGKPPIPKTEHEAQCPSCNCRFSFTEDEISREERLPLMQRDVLALDPNRRRVVWTIACPQQGCSQEVRVQAP